jgi:hypothetical protein
VKSPQRLTEAVSHTCPPSIVLLQFIFPLVRVYNVDILTTFALEVGAVQ